MEGPGTGISRPRCVVIGAGNVASHLAVALDAVADVVQVCARHLESARALSGKLRSACAVDSAADVVDDADFYVISVCDDAIADVAALMPEVSGVVAHTSGSVPMDVLGRFARHGVFYPLQTFSKARDIDFAEVPFFLEANSALSHAGLDQMAHRLSNRVYDADSQHRRVLHVAAVFACNYANLMWDISAELLKKADYPFDVFSPLLKETLNKALTATPFASQTGPAMRGDTHVMTNHAESLPAELSDIYKTLAETIMSRHNIKPIDNE